MWQTRSVQLSVRLPYDVALEAEEVQRTDPDSISRMIQSGLTRRIAYNRLGEDDRLRAESAASESTTGFAQT